MKVYVDTSACTRTGYCAGIAPDIFTLPEDSYAAQATDHELTDPEAIAQAREAERSCPFGAIHLQEKRKKEDRAD